MSRPLLRNIAILIGAMALWTVRAEAEVKIVRPEKDNQNVSQNRLAIVSDGPTPWKLRYWSAVGRYESKLVPVSPDRMLFIHGLVLHLIDTQNGIVLRRWVLADQIKDVLVEGDKFQVRTLSGGNEKTVTMTVDSPPPTRWLDSLLLHRGVTNEGSWYDRDARLEPKFPSTLKRYAMREPLAPKDAERLIVEVADAARRDPFSPQFGVCLALLMRDLGRKDAESVFRRAIEKPTNFYGELFAIADNLENGGEAEWSTLAFEQAYARQWQQGTDPRLVYSLLARLLTLYLPYDLRLDIPDARRAKLIERVYANGPYVEGAPEAWRQLAVYFDGRGDSKNGALWRTRASEAVLKNGIAWELGFYLEAVLRGMMAAFLSVLLYYVVLQCRYAPQRRLIRAGQTWRQRSWSLPSLSMTCWDRQDRHVFYGLVVLAWLLTGLFGGFGEAALHGWPLAGVSGTLRAPKTQEFLRSLPASSDRDSLLALSLQQAEFYNEAETLYRTLPDSAWTWNNFGALQSVLGKTKDAKESFERALRIDPGLSEAAFNLGRPVSDLWVEMHSKFLPGQKMLAVPTHDVFYRAERGTYWRLAGRALLGPFSGWPVAQRIAQERTDRPINWQTKGIFYGSAALLLALTGLALFSPRQEVTQPPGRRHWFAELVLPGTAREWGRVGGLLCAVASCGIVGLLSRSQSWTPLARVGGSGNRAFGLPPSLPVLPPAWPADLSWFWIAISVLVVLIFVANAVVVVGAQRRLRRGAT